MPIPGVNRYSDLLKSVVSGPFYSSRGYVIPWKLGLSEIRLETRHPSTEFALYVNEKMVSTVVSDVQGNVVFSQHFDRGDSEVRLLNLTTNVSITTWLTVREYALWLAAYAAALEEIDDNIIDVRNNIAVETVTSEDVDNIYGSMVNQYNAFGQDLDSYRTMLHEFRTGYRSYSNRYRGLETVVSEITQVPPFGYARRMWGPNWVLDQSFAKNHRFMSRSHRLTNSTGNITGVDLLRVEPDVTSVSVNNLHFDPVAETLQWEINGDFGEAQQVTDGEIFLPGPDYVPSAFLGALPTHFLGFVVEPFAVVGGSNDFLYLNLDDMGSIAIQLVTGLPNPTAANVVLDINNALVADPRYGIPYAAAASVHNTKVLLLGQLVANSSIVVEQGVQNAAVSVFGNRVGNIVFAPDFMDGVYGVNILGAAIDLNAGVASIQYEYDDTVTPVTRRLRWTPPGAGPGAWVSIHNDGLYTLPSFAGPELVVDVSVEDMENLSSVLTFTLGYSAFVEHIGQSKGIWVRVSIDDLPAVVASDLIQVDDDVSIHGESEVPDYWWLEDDFRVSTVFEPSQVTNGKDAKLAPSDAFRVRFDTVADNLFYFVGRAETWPRLDPGPRGQNYPQRSFGGLYDYEEFEMIWSGWISSGYSANLEVTPGISFDGGVTWLDGTVYNLDPDTNNYEDPTYFEQESRIPADLVDRNVLVRLKMENTAGVGVDLYVDGVSIDVRYITSRYLTNATVPRSRHRQYHGDLVWCWSPTPLTLSQKEYLGLQHKKPNNNRPFAGVEITAVSFNTNSGDGVLEYEYNSVGDIRRLRWNSPGSTWGAGLGWLTIIGNGLHTLYAPNGSYLSTDIVRSLLPTYTGTPPATIRQRQVEISDETTKQGHPRWISPAHSSIDIFDVSEYSSSGETINLKGASTEAEFSNCELENLELIPADPFQYAYLVPTVLPVVGEQLLVSTAFPHVATLDHLSDQDQFAAVLYEDGVPVPNTDTAGVPVWWFNSAGEIEIAAGPPPAWYFNPSASYTIDYQLLHRVTTPVIDLTNLTGFGHAPFGHYPFGHPPRFDDYSWLIDHFTWMRLDSMEDSYPATVPIFFNGSTGKAYLEQPSDMNKTGAHLASYTSNVEEMVPTRNWRFLNTNTVEIDLSQLKSDTQYYLTHSESRVYPSSPLTATLEHRCADSEVNCLAATWYPVERNEMVPVFDSGLVTDYTYHQLRLQVSGPLRDLRDFRIRSLVLKGLYSGYGGSTPGLHTAWGG